MKVIWSPLAEQGIKGTCNNCWGRGFNRWKSERGRSSLLALLSKADLVKQTEWITNRVNYKGHLSNRCHILGVLCGGGEGTFILCWGGCAGFLIIYFGNLYFVSHHRHSRWDYTKQRSCCHMRLRETGRNDHFWSTHSGLQYFTFPHLIVIATAWGHYYLGCTEMRTGTLEAEWFFQGHTS